MGSPVWRGPDRAAQVESPHPLPRYQIRSSSELSKVRWNNAVPNEITVPMFDWEQTFFLKRKIMLVG